MIQLFTKEKYKIKFLLNLKIKVKFECFIFNLKEPDYELKEIFNLEIAPGFTTWDKILGLQLEIDIIKGIIFEIAFANSTELESLYSFHSKPVFSFIQNLSCPDKRNIAGRLFLYRIRKHSRNTQTILKDLFRQRLVACE